MRNRLPILVPAVSAVLLVAACATMHDPGWRGQNATPFDTARARCTAEASGAEAGTARDARFTDCMARHGWHREGG